MPPKPKVAPKAKAQTATSAASKATPKPLAKATSKAGPAAPNDIQTQDDASEPSVAEAESFIATLTDNDWAELASLEEAPSQIAAVLQATLTLLGDPEATSWSAAKTALAEPQQLLRELRSLGAWGAADDLTIKTAALLQTKSVRDLQDAVAAKSGGAPSSPGARATTPGPRSAKARAKPPAAKLKSAPSSKAPPPPAPSQGSSAAVALGLMVTAFLAARKHDKAPPFPMMWPLVPYSLLHVRLQQAMFSRQTACVICSEPRSVRSVLNYCQLSGAAVCDLKSIHVQVQLSKTLSISNARAQLGSSLHQAITQGCRLVLVLGSAPPNLRHYCDAKQVPIQAFDGEQSNEAAKSLDLLAAAKGFHVVLVVEASKAKAEQVLAHVIPGFDEMAVLVLDASTLPCDSALKPLKPQPNFHAAISLLALPPNDTQALEGKGTSHETTETSSVSTLVNEEDFEYKEHFTDDWEQRWFRGPAKTDETGKPIREGIINPSIAKYPSDPKDCKVCMQLVGGAPNAPCSGLWTSFTPLARPQEVEFEFTMNGKVDVPNACLVFTQKPFEGALPECKVGVQFVVRGGMYLSGGSGNLVKISNDGKIRNDKWNKVLLKIDWKEKHVIGQVDSRGKGYAPAVQTVPFRDATCEGFGYVFIYNMEMQATCWVHSLRIKQDSHHVGEDKASLDALDARAYMAAQIKQREYQRAVDADMALGMKMGAIKSTSSHGMNLAQEQAANSSSHMAMH